jgi:hypothetical protein
VTRAYLEACVRLLLAGFERCRPAIEHPCCYFHHVPRSNTSGNAIDLLSLFASQSYESEPGPRTDHMCVGTMLGSITVRMQLAYGEAGRTSQCCFRGSQISDRKSRFQFSRSFSPAFGHMQRAQPSYLPVRCRSGLNGRYSILAPQHQTLIILLYCALFFSGIGAAFWSSIGHS